MEFTVIVQEHMHVYTLEPYVREMRRRGVKLHFVISQRVEGECGNLIASGEPVHFLEEIERGHRRLGILLNALRLAFTPEDYSPLYQKWNRKEFKEKFRRYVGMASRLLPSWKRHTVNRNLGRILGRLIDNPFPTERVLLVTKVYAPHLLCASGLRIHTIMGSWDHPGKYPMGHPSEKVFVWSEGLGEDWRYFQDRTDIRISYPVLHDYAIRANDLDTEELLTPDTGRLMYPASSSSWGQDWVWSEELRLIEALCEATAGSGRILFIKPKPNSRPGEFDRFLSYDHVEVGHYQNTGEISKFVLSEAYNRKRLEELSRCDLVINLGTTFAVDAATYGLPVAQLRIERPGDMPGISRFPRSPHLARHYFDRDDCVYRVGEEQSLAESLAFLGRPPSELHRAREFALHLRRFIMPQETMEQAVRRVADACLED